MDELTNTTIKKLLVEGWNYVILDNNNKYKGVDVLPDYVDQPSSFSSAFWVLDKEDGLVVQSSYNRITKPSEVGCLIL